MENEKRTDSNKVEQRRIRLTKNQLQKISEQMRLSNCTTFQEYAVKRLLLQDPTHVNLIREVTYLKQSIRSVEKNVDILVDAMNTLLHEVIHPDTALKTQKDDEHPIIQESRLIVEEKLKALQQYRRTNYYKTLGKE